MISPLVTFVRKTHKSFLQVKSNQKTDVSKAFIQYLRMKNYFDVLFQKKNICCGVLYSYNQTFCHDNYTETLQRCHQ